MLKWTKQKIHRNHHLFPNNRLLFKVFTSASMSQFICFVCASIVVIAIFLLCLSCYTRNCSLLLRIISSPNPILDEHFRLILKQYWLNYREAVGLQSEQWMEVKRRQCKFFQKHVRFIERSVAWTTNVIAFYTTFGYKFFTLLHTHSFKL